jgi:SAM-dependent methyltransferase
MQARLRRNRTLIERELGRRKDRQYFSPAFLAQHRAVIPAIQAHARGRVIDLGCGDMPFRDVLPSSVIAYETLDVAPRWAPPTFIADIQNMPVVPSNAYDTAICLETLEHVADPWLAIREVYRILAPDGVAIVTVPHLSRLHDEPHDYYRFTAHGLRHLFSSAGFADIRIEAKGGLFAFLGHQASSAFMSLLWSARPLRRPAWILNKWLITLPSAFADRWLHGTTVTPLGYLLVACKPVTASNVEGGR